MGIVETAVTLFGSIFDFFGSIVNFFLELYYQLYGRETDDFCAPYRANESFSYNVLFREGDLILCAGVYIAINYILTTATCSALLQNKIDKVTLLGDTFMNERLKPKYKEIIPEPGYKKSSLTNDIALIELNLISNIKTTDFYKSTDESVKLGDQLEIHWFNNRRGGSLFNRNLGQKSIYLVCDSVNVQNNDKCSRIFGPEGILYESTSSGLVCGTEVSQGYLPYGSPLTKKNKIVGLFLGYAGNDACNASISGCATAYLNIKDHVNWIKEKTNVQF